MYTFIICGGKYNKKKEDNVALSSFSYSLVSKLLISWKSCTTETCDFIGIVSLHLDSKKGGGGYVQITKISSDKKKYIKSLIYERIGEEISYNAAKEVIKSLEKINILTERESKIILYSIEDKVLCIPISELKDKLRANILQNIVIGLLHIDESA